jgi:RNA polymerase sigma factor (sigma-70 family)
VAIAVKTLSLQNQDHDRVAEPHREANLQGFRRLLVSPQYERLRGQLIRIFARRGCQFPQDLADETISRVMQKIDDIAPTYEGDPARYFYGVARNVYLEYTRRPKTVQLEENRRPTNVEDSEHLRNEEAHACLERCLNELPADERRLIFEYYQYEKTAKIDHRKELAEELGMGLNALRIRVFRIRQRLYDCVTSCTKSFVRRK